MAPNDNRTPAPTEDTRTSEEHSRRAAENADVLAESARRNEAKAPNDGPVQGLKASQASEDTTQAEANQRQIKEDHDALQAQARRVEASAPPEARTDRPRKS